MVGPFSDNYWRDWMLYHGGMFVVGFMVTIIGLVSHVQMLVSMGSMLSFVALVVGALNALVDHTV